MGKGEIARYEQFLLFPQCFQKACFPEVSKGVIVWEWVKVSTKRQILRLVQIESFAEDKINLTENLKFVLGRVENIVGKGENAGYHSVFKKNFFQGH